MTVISSLDGSKQRSTGREKLETGAGATGAGAGAGGETRALVVYVLRPSLNHLSSTFVWPSLICGLHLYSFSATAVLANEQLVCHN